MTVSTDSENGSAPGEKTAQFGTFRGVYLPSVLTILGVILYLRLGWVVGQVGLIGAIAIITISSAITLLTGLSIAATATNMKVGGGGAYYMISRSFGIEAGAAIGLPLYLAQALGISFYLAGFAESLKFLFPELSMILVALVSLGTLTVLAALSADLALKTQFLIFCVIVASLFSFLSGDPVPVSETTHLNWESVPFWAVFAVFFPAVTGIEAGISMSGDLKNPSRSLPWGTVAAVVSGFVVYIVLAVVLFHRAPETLLINNTLIMKETALIPALILAGLWGATLSSALGALLGAPRTLQALAQDRVVPQVLGKGFGKQRNPRIAVAVTFLLATGGILLGSLDVIAPILSMFFLTSYGALNLVAGLEGMIGNPSWRPTFRTPWLLCLMGAAGCFAVMLMINPGAAMVALVCCVGVYTLMRRRGLNARWSDIRRGLLLFMARSSIYQLNDYADDARSWRPNMLVLSGSPRSRWYLIELSHAMAHGQGFLTVAAVLKSSGAEDKIEAFSDSLREYLEKQRVPALTKVKYAEDFLVGVRHLIHDYGIGSLVPNTIVCGETEDEDRFIEFSELIRSVHGAGKNLLVIREDQRQSVPFRPDRQGRHVKNIDVWWGRQYHNAPLMLALAYMLQTSPEWMGARLTLKSLVNSAEEKDGVTKSLRDFLDEGRVIADLEVIERQANEAPFDIIRTQSQNTDLVFIGLRPPESDEDAQDYSRYYGQLLQHTKGFPLTVITLAGEDISFKDIFA